MSPLMGKNFERRDIFELFVKYKITLFHEFKINTKV